MSLRHDAHAWVMGKLAPMTVRYGDELQLAGGDLAKPRRHRVPTRHGKVPVLIYEAGTREHPRPAYVHHHGGAFVMRHPGMDDFFCRFVAVRAGVAVVNVDYTAAPQARYPQAHEECHDVYAWLTGHGAELGLAPDRLAVGGFSAGGNLAASLCLQARDAGTPLPLLQVLGVPSLDVAEDYVDKQPVGRPMLGPEILALVRGTYFRDASRRAEPYASPLRADDLAGLPPAVVVTAERDLLRREGDAYAARLVDAGVAVDHHVVPRADHYFLDPGDQRQAEREMQRLADAVAAALTGAGPRLAR
ncbi:alpha/beta hydrolase [Nocardioidaceae bacterium]|nr:alpha/beta hydrolase [Nocardioidaceae bacterium]